MQAHSSKALLLAIGDATVKSIAAAVASAWSPSAIAKTLKLSMIKGEVVTLRPALQALTPPRAIPHFNASFINCFSLFIPHILAKEGLKRTTRLHGLSSRQQDAVAVLASAALCVAFYLGPSVKANNILISGQQIGLQELVKSKGMSNFLTTTASLYGREVLDLAAFTWPKNRQIVNGATIGGAVFDKIHAATSLKESAPAGLGALSGFLVLRAIESRILLLVTESILERVATPAHQQMQSALADT